MKPLLSAILTCILISFLSCQKDAENDLPQQPVPGDTLLSRILVYDAVSPDKSLMEFLYDDQDRVTEIKEIFFDSVGGVMNIQEQYSTYFYYNGAEKNPFKSYGYTLYIYGEHEVFHFYDDQGRRILDSLGAPDQSHMLAHFNYSPAKLVIASSYYDENGVLFDQLTDSFNLSKGNITSAFIPYPLTQDGAVAFDYTHDDRENPLSKLNIAPCLGFDKLNLFEKFWVLPFGTDRNNIIRRVGYAGTPPSTTGFREYQFIYNDNNLPVTGIFLVNGQDTEGIRVVYEYKD